jgi:hypothetical protein
MAQTNQQLKDENERLKALLAFIRSELDEILESIDEEAEIEEEE